MMKIEFIKSVTTENGAKQVVGQKAKVWDDYGKELIKQGYAVTYSGNMNTKTKTNFFKPK